MEEIVDSLEQSMDHVVDAIESLSAYRTCDRLPPALDPRVIAEPILEMPEHEQIAAGGATIDWLFRTTEKIKAGRKVLGTCYLPKVQGDLSALFDFMLDRLLGRQPDFLVVLDWNYWSEATSLQREILCFHELRHARQALDAFGAPRFDRAGMPIWTIAGHDVEEFDDVVRRYGMHSSDLERFFKAITENLESEVAHEG